MYCLKEEQIDFILNDIRARGIELEDLQSNLLDHVCCIVEENLKDGDDFERFYFETIKRFFKKDLFEIEEETISLLTFKNYYVMKKIMMRSGAISATLSIAGIVMKLFHLPGASPCVILGVLGFSFLFLPLLLVLKAREQQGLKDKLVLVLGALGAISVSLGILAKVMHWPFATDLGVSGVGILLLLFLPIYFISGIRNPATKVNTAVSSILLVAGCGLCLLLVTAKRSHWILTDEMKVFARNELMLKNEQRQLRAFSNKYVQDSTQRERGKKIFQLCENLKSAILESETGSRTLDPDFEKNDLFIPDQELGYFYGNTEGFVKLKSLEENMKAYNERGMNGTRVNFIPLPLEKNILGHSMDVRFGFSTVMVNLNFFSQIQMLVLQNEMEGLALK
jgi:hypothetical protein